MLCPNDHEPMRYSMMRCQWECDKGCTVSDQWLAANRITQGVYRRPPTPALPPTERPDRESEVIADAAAVLIGEGASDLARELLAATRRR